MKKLSILGSTGSIGTNTLRVARHFSDRFSVAALAAGRNVELLARQVMEFEPELAVVQDEHLAHKLKDLLPDMDLRILHGKMGYEVAASLQEVDVVVSAMVGAAGLLPTLAALEAKKTVALANKETLVMAGQIVMDMARENQTPILPVDSEHSAIFQCLAHENKNELSKILLTASGGPFREKPAEEFESITVKDALNHPTWVMGSKITVDSATLMNKGLEVIEARWLFDVPSDQIQVVVHPQSVVHSMVAYQDGSILAQMGAPDMRGAIAYALSHPERLPLEQEPLDFAKLGSLTFEEPNLEKFPCLTHAFNACREGKTYPAVLNAANEVAVAAFLDGRIPFTRIPKLVGLALDKHSPMDAGGLDHVLSADEWARRETDKWIKDGK